VVRDANFLVRGEKKDADKILQLLAYNNLPNIVIFNLNADKIEEKNKITTLLKEKGKVIKLTPLSKNEIKNFVLAELQKNNKEIDAKNLELFLNHVPNNLQVIHNELTKLTFLKENVITQELIENNVSKYLDVDIFELSDAFVNDKTDLFLRKFKEYLTLSNDQMSFFFLLSSNLAFTRDCLILKSQRKNEGKIAELLNAHPYRVKMALRMKHLKIAELNDKILLLYKINKLQLSGTQAFDELIEIELIKNLSKIKGEAYGA
jgi:DNA polymerase-3 subunit delta